jgi:hypothetical protein
MKVWRLIIVVLLVPVCSIEAIVHFSVVQSPTGTMDLWDVDWHPTEPMAILVGNGGSTFNSRIYFYTDVEDPMLPGTLSVPPDDLDHQYQGVAWHPDGDFAVLIGSDYAVVKYDRDTGSLTDITSPDNDIDFTAVALNPVDGWFYMPANVDYGSYDMLKIFRTDGTVVEGPLANGTSYANYTGPYWCPSACWRPDGDYMLIASVGYANADYALYAFDPNQDTFPGVAMYSVNQSNTYSVEFNPVPFNGNDYFALSGIGGAIYRVDDSGNGTTNGSLSLDMKDPYYGSYSLNYPYAAGWSSNGEAALCAGRRTFLARFNGIGNRTDRFDLPGPYPSNTYLFDCDWKPDSNRGLLVGEESWVLKFYDTDVVYPTVTPTPAFIPTATPTPDHTATPTPTSGAPSLPATSPAGIILLAIVCGCLLAGKAGGKSRS